MKFKSLSISEWRQFKSVNIQFHERLTILTGSNAAGKTTILSNLLGRHGGWNIPLGSTPRKNRTTGKWGFYTRWNSWKNYLLIFDEKTKKESSIGDLHYSNGEHTPLNVPDVVEGNNPQYHISIPKQQPVSCLFVPSHRSILSHRNIDSMPMHKKSMKDTYQEYLGSTKQRLLGSQPEPTSMMMKRTLMGWAMQGYKNAKVVGDEEQVEFFEGFEEVLKKVLPGSLNFQGLEIRSNEIVFSCNGDADDFIFEQASGGIGAILDIVWQIYLYSTKENGEFTAIVDEVENHLHPIMQRRILPDLINAFPHVTFIVSTHSPLVISSVKDSNVFALRYNDEGKIISQQIDLVNEARTANEVLDEVLGVSFSMPIWAEEALERILTKYKKIENKDMLRQMRTELSENGLEKIMPDAITDIYNDKTA